MQKHFWSTLNVNCSIRSFQLYRPRLLKATSHYVSLETSTSKRMKDSKDVTSHGSPISSADHNAI